MRRWALRPPHLQFSRNTNGTIAGILARPIHVQLFLLTYPQEQ